MLFFVNKFDYSIKKQHANPRKVYAVDIALAREVSFRFTDDKGRMVENLLYLELRQKGDEIYYHKGKYECDFIIKKGLKVVNAIQVCYKLNENNRKRELNGLLEAMDTHKLKKGFIITNDNEEDIIIENKKIIVKPIWKYLMDID